MTDHTETPPPARPVPRRRFDVRDSRIRGGAVVAVALAVGVGVWLAVRGGGSSSPSPVPSSSTAIPVSPAGLKTLASAVGQPIYWAGAQPGRQYELTRSRDGRVWIRYLPSAAKIGERTTPYLTIGTYPVTNAYAATKAVAAQKGSTRVDAGGGGIAFYSASHPTSVYLAYPGSGYQIEVFDPDASEARSLVQSGKIQAVGSNGTATSSTAAVALDEQQLKKRAASSSAPVYWVGPQPGVRYELTQTTTGRTFVRYLPSGADAGSTTPYLTVGTYPVKGAFAVTEAAAKTTGNVAVDVPGGGVGFYSAGSPSNVHLAYPGKDYQIEVFDPSPQRVRQLVSTGRLRPVG